MRDDLDAVSTDWIRETDRIGPGPESAILLRRRDAYRALYPALRDVFPRLSES